MNRHRVLVRTLIASALFVPCLVAAQAYPEKNVQYIIPFVPGGESDVMARWQQAVFRNKYKHELIVVNKPGAGGGLAWSQLNGMSADGYTIMGCNLPHIVLQPLGAYRGVAVPTSTPPDAQKKVSDMMAALNKEPQILKWMRDGGFEVVDIPYDRNAEFMKERGKEYMEIAKHMGLVK